MVSLVPWEKPPALRGPVATPVKTPIPMLFLLLGVKGEGLIQPGRGFALWAH